MRELLRATNAYRAIKSEADGASHATLVLFPDEVYLRALLKECAKAFFRAEDGSRTARLIDGENYADCLVYPAEGGKLTAEVAAELIGESVLRPVEGTKKLFVLDAFQTVTPLVQNKLLKSLEEPAEGVYFLIGATASHAVLPTVLSRVKKYEESPFSEEAVLEALKRNHGGAGAAEAAAACGGVYSVAEELMGGGEEFRLAEEFLAGENPVLCRQIGERKNKRAFFSAVKLLLRDMLFYKTERDRYAAIRTENARRLAEEYPAGAILSAILFTDEAERQIQFNANFAQAALMLAVQIREEKEKWQKLS